MSKRAKPRKKAAPEAPLIEEDWDPSDIGEYSVDYLIEHATREGIMTYDLETSGLDPRKDHIEGVAFYIPNEKDKSRPPIRAWFPFIEGTMDWVIGSELKPLRPAMHQRKTMEQLRALWALPSVIKIRHNGIFDDGMLLTASGCETPILVADQIADSMLADYISDERRKRYGLKIRVEQTFNVKMTSYDEASSRQAVFGFARKKPLGGYAMDDCRWAYRLFWRAIESIREQSPPKQQKDNWCSPLGGEPGIYSALEKILWKIEMPVQRILMEMELTGCLIDWEWLVEVQRRLEQDKLRIIDEIQKCAGWVPNLRSPKQVSDFLFKPEKEGGLGLPTGGLDYNEDLDQFTTRDKLIAHFGKRYPAVKLLLDYRSLEVIDRSFCKKLIGIAQEDVRVYAHFHQTGTVIGRLTSAQPVNLMNQPRDKNLIRKSFCSHLPVEVDPERAELDFFDADYSQVELRLVAHLANEKNMIEVYTSGGVCTCDRFVYWFECKDDRTKKCKWEGLLKPGLPGVALLPDGTALRLCPMCQSQVASQDRCRHVDLHQRTAEDVGVKRNPLAKALNFGTAYRMGAPKFVTYADLYDEAGAPRLAFAEELLYKWHEAFPDVAPWQDATVEKLIRNDYIAYTLMRRRRRLDVEWKINEYRAGTQAIQFEVSGTCQDIIKAAMIELHKQRQRKIDNTPPAESKLWRRLKFLIQVHDELVLEGPRQIRDEILVLIKRCMEGVAPSLRVPITASVRWGTNWDQTH